MLNSQSEHEKQLCNVNNGIFQDISSASENVCIEKIETVGKEGDGPNKKVKSPPKQFSCKHISLPAFQCKSNAVDNNCLEVTKTLEKEEVNQKKETFEDKEVTCL